MQKKYDGGKSATYIRRENAVIKGNFDEELFELEFKIRVLKAAKRVYDAVVKTSDPAKIPGGRVLGKMIEELEFMQKTICQNDELLLSQRLANYDTRTAYNKYMRR